MCTRVLFYHKGLVANCGEGGGRNEMGVGGEACEVLPLRIGGWKSVSHAEGGFTTSFWVVFTL